MAGRKKKGKGKKTTVEVKDVHTSYSDSDAQSSEAPPIEPEAPSPEAPPIQPEAPSQEAEEDASLIEPNQEAPSQQLSETQRIEVGDSSGESIAGAAVGKGKKKRIKKAPVHMSEEQETLFLNLLKDNDILYNKKHKEYKNKGKRDRIWQEIAEEVGLSVDKLQTWFKTQRTVYGKITTTKSGQQAEILSHRQEWVKKNLEFIGSHICRVTARTSKLPPRPPQLQRLPSIVVEDISESSRAPSPGPMDTQSEDILETSGASATLKRRKSTELDSEPMQKLIKKSTETSKIIEGIANAFKESNQQATNPRSQFASYITSEFENIDQSVWMDYQLEIMKVTHSYIKQSEEKKAARERQQQRPTIVISTPIKASTSQQFQVLQPSTSQYGGQSTIYYSDYTLQPQQMPIQQMPSQQMSSQQMSTQQMPSQQMPTYHQMGTQQQPQHPTFQSGPSFQPRVPPAVTRFPLFGSTIPSTPISFADLDTTLASHPAGPSSVRSFASMDTPQPLPQTDKDEEEEQTDEQ